MFAPRPIAVESGQICILYISLGVCNLIYLISLELLNRIRIPISCCKYYFNIITSVQIFQLKFHSYFYKRYLLFKTLSWLYVILLQAIQHFNIYLYRPRNVHSTNIILSDYWFNRNVHCIAYYVFYFSIIRNEIERMYSHETWNIPLSMATCIAQRVYTVGNLHGHAYSKKLTVLS